MTARKVFHDVKVVDFTWAGAGPLTTKYLADYGATVVRIESRSRPDLLRTTPPYKDGTPGVDRAAYFGIYNPNKYSMALNMNHAKGKGLVRNKARCYRDTDEYAGAYRPSLPPSWHRSESGRAIWLCPFVRLA